MNTIPKLTRTVLHAIQYSFPLSPQPFLDMANYLDIPPESLITTLKRLYEKKIIKRVGFTFNNRRLGFESALVAYNIDENLIPIFSARLKENPYVKHNYIRKHEKYNVWYTIRGRSERDIKTYVQNLAKELQVDDFIILPSIKTYKLSVKYDLDKGISWSKPRNNTSNDKRKHEYELEEIILKKLRRIPIKIEPYKEIAETHGYSEDELINILKEMMDDGIVMDYGGVLDGETLGFKYNCMVTLKGDEKICEIIYNKVYEATHIVLRKIIGGEWDKNIYFMIHGTRKSVLEKRIDEIMKEVGIEDYLKIYSLARLK